MRVDTSFRIWGYPGLAIISFLFAAGAGIVLLFNILFYDRSGHEEYSFRRSLQGHPNLASAGCGRLRLRVRAKASRSVPSRARG